LEQLAYKVQLDWLEPQALMAMLVQRARKAPPELRAQLVHKAPLVSLVQLAKLAPLAHRVLQACKAPLD
jgi:hypothetical protein